ncbi:hypothetical protein H257_08004 [Aphanomyces astaci]|uniref:Uncharacterized protein n=1 Tax=Aphanomyces astaci TaxID=112090 RepID=W4GGT3_APHAT|nr:hypothetical protein H257_08004 [Aphanomyces astaci]ETV78481.1 hypothetical protein H257_08004 [Aphanomyces astaci]|eukprot:XP_009832062.1 hypothetical protein H257_08004 [Aphanomyces astaci]
MEEMSQVYHDYAQQVAYDSPTPIVDRFHLQGGNAALATMINLTQPEFETIWAIVESVVVPAWTLGRGRKSPVSSKDAFFMTLVVLKHYNAWYKHALDFRMKAPTFEKMVHRVLEVDRWPTTWSVLVDMGHQGIQHEFRSVQPKRRPQGGFRTPRELERNSRVSSDRVLEENYFGQCSLWRIMSTTYESKLIEYRVFCCALTNAHVSWIPLRGADGSGVEIKSNIELDARDDLTQFRLKSTGAGSHVPIFYHIGDSKELATSTQHKYQMSGTRQQVLRPQPTRESWTTNEIVDVFLGPPIVQKTMPQSTYGGLHAHLIPSAFVNTKSEVVFKTLDWTISDDLPFSWFEKERTHEYASFKGLSHNQVKHYMHLLRASVVEDIMKELPDKFGVAGDGKEVLLSMIYLIKDTSLADVQGCIASVQQDLMEGEFADLLAKVQKVMLSCKALNNAAELKKLTSLKSRLLQATRWSSAFEMLVRFQKLLPTLERMPKRVKLKML